MFELIVRVGSVVVERRKYDQDEVNIGRGRGMHVRLAEPAASKHHAVIRRERNAYVIHDLGSTNGTFLGEERIRSRALNDGDTIRVGSFLLEFRPLATEPGWFTAPAPAPRDPALQVVLGNTYALGPQSAREQRERSANRRARLELSGGKVVAIENDVLMIGSGDGCAIRTARGTPRVSAVIVRGPAGFSLFNLEPSATIGGNPLGERLWLKDGDRVGLGASLVFTFKLTA